MSNLVYLCGPITGLSYNDATLGWRHQFTEMLKDTNIQCVSPMRGKDYLKNEQKLEGHVEMYKDSLMSNNKNITTRDRFDVSRCDLIVANFLDAKERVSIGSMIEFGWADAFRKPVIMISQPDNIHMHGMTSEIAGFIVDSVEDAAEITRRMFTTEIV